MKLSNDVKTTLFLLLGALILILLIVIFIKPTNEINQPVENELSLYKVKAQIEKEIDNFEEPQHVAYKKLIDEKIAECKRFDDRYFTAMEMTTVDDIEKLHWHCGYRHNVFAVSAYDGHSVGPREHTSWHLLEDLKAGKNLQFAEYDPMMEYEVEE